MRHRLHRWLFRRIDRWGDRVCDSKRLSEIDFAYLDWLQRPLCLLLGHEPTLDHCLRPEHDCCLYCGKIMPGQARERWRRPHG